MADEPDEDEEDDGLGEPRRRLEDTPRYLWRVVRTAVDYLALNTETGREMMVRAQPYPEPFFFSHLEAHAGAELGCWVGMRQGPSPMIMFLPGTFATKDAANTREKVMRLFDETQAHLCAVDLRGFGHSSDLLSTAGYLEALDVAHIARDFLQDDRVTEVILAGESLGAATALIAGKHARRTVDGVLALNPFADLDWIIRLIATAPPRLHPSRVIHHAFSTFLRHVTGEGDASFDEYLERVSENLGVRPAELVYRASPRYHVPDLTMPTLVLHATDDPVIPVFHSHVLAGAAEGNSNVNVHLTSMGGHATFDVWDEDWYWDTVHGFLSEVLA